MNLVMNPQAQASACVSGPSWASSVWSVCMHVYHW